MKLSLLTAALLLAGTSLVYAHCGKCPGDAAKADGKADAKATCPAAGACALKPGDAATPAKAAEEKHAYGTVDTNALKALLKAKTPLLLLDARSGKWDDGQRLPGAKALSPDASDADIGTALPDKGALVVTYCSNLKCPASKMLAERLVKLGYTNVMKYPDGIAAWLADGNAVDKAK